MRLTIMACVLATSLSGVVRAGDLTDPFWVKAPDRAEWAKAYPAAAAKTGLAGSARLRCAATTKGLLDDCSVVEETPAGQGFGAAALALTGGMEMRPTSQSGQPVAGREVVVPVKFEAGLLTDPHAVVTHPDWLKKPNGQDFAQWWPANARGRAGKASVECVVTNRGLLDNCNILAETPVDAGFGAAALLMTPSFLMRPMTVDGLPVGGAAVVIPITWGGGDPWEFFGREERVVGLMPWSATPTLAEMAKAFPANAIGNLGQGHVVLRCSLSRQGGKLSNCNTVTEEPTGRGFGAAARSLIEDFTAAAPAALHAERGDVLVNLPFDFRDPSRATPPLEVVDPAWVAQVDPSAAPALFPESAAKAGYKTGIATVECEVTHTGALTGCSVVRENPPGYGFGKSALAVASVMVMNPWTQQGTPVDGARVRLPVTIDLPQDGATPPGASTTAKP